MARGCHVLSEKPLAATLADGRDIVSSAQKAGRLVAVIQNRRYTRVIRHVRSLIESGTIGAVTEVAVDFYLGAHFGGFREEMEHALLLDMAIHPFDMVRFVIGADPVSVFCHECHGFKGSIDIEGGHDPVYRDELEMTGQVHALTHLKRCRGGSFVPNPGVS